MKPAGAGSIVNFGSIAPTIAVPNLSVYNACKAAAFGLTRSLARDLGPDGIRVNSVVPGAILTERQLRDWISPSDRAAILERQCLKREMVEEDVAEMVLFLASDAARGCTGQEFRVDGGHF
jgi:NAD(P)-dependent dehydrogenase (short-subunit alcohol dehydrogenase family)